MNQTQGKAAMTIGGKVELSNGFPFHVLHRIECTWVFISIAREKKYTNEIIPPTFYLPYIDRDGFTCIIQVLLWMLCCSMAYRNTIRKIVAIQEPLQSFYSA